MTAHAITQRRAWILWTLLFFATTLSFLDRQVLSVLAPKITAEFTMTNTVYSRVIFAFVLSYTIMFALGGRVMDALGTRLGLAVAVGFWSLAAALHSLAAGVWSLGVARFLLGVGEGPCMPAVAKGAIEWSAPRQRALAIGFVNSGAAIGSVIAPPLAVWSAVCFGWRGAFVLVGLLGLAWLVAWHFASRGLPRPEPAATRRVPVSFAGLLARPAVLRLLVARFCFDPVFYLYAFWIPQYFARERGMSLEEIGALSWIPFLALGVANVISGSVSDLFVFGIGWPARQVRLGLMLVAALVTPASWLASLAETPAVAIGLMSVLMFAHGFWISNYIALVGDTVASDEVGTAVGLSGTFGGVAGMISSLSIGMVVDRFSFAPVFVASALLYPLAWIVLRTPIAPAPQTDVSVNPPP